VSKTRKSLIRSAYLIDEEGVIVKAFGGVKPKDNAAQMLEEL
jgi:peroxiredoxin Q/BCP